MKTSSLGVLALSLGSSDAFVFPTTSSSQKLTVVQLYNGPQNGGTTGSSYMADQYGKVGIDSPWGNTNPHSGVPARMSTGGKQNKTPADFPLAKGRIATVTGGSFGASKYLNPPPTKWSTTSHVEPYVHRDDGLQETAAPSSGSGYKMPAGAHLAKGRILTVTGGNLGSDKFLKGGGATKWSSTTMKEPTVQRDDGVNQTPPSKTLLPTVPAVAKGQISNVMGGNVGSSKFVKGSATKWAGTKWEEPHAQRN